MNPSLLPRASRGLSLIELLIFIGIVSTALAALLRVFVQTTVASADPLVQRQALAIAESLMAEVQLMPFTFCDSDDPDVETATGPTDCSGTPDTSGPEAGESRSALPAFDHVNDYHGLSMNGIRDLTGSTVPGLDGYSASIAVAAADLGNLTAASGQVLRIDVRVTGPGGTTIDLAGYRSRHAPNAPL